MATRIIRGKVSGMFESSGGIASIIALVFTIALLFVPIESIPLWVKVIALVSSAGVVAVIYIKKDRTSKSKLEITTHRDGIRLGFCIIVRNKALKLPKIICNGVEYPIEEKSGRKSKQKLEWMYVDEPYFFYPYGINATQMIKSGYLNFQISDITTNTVLHSASISMGDGTTGTFTDLTHATTLNTLIIINAVNFEKKIEYSLDIRTAGLTVKRIDPLFPVPFENISFIFEEIKKPPFWKRLFRIKQ